MRDYEELVKALHKRIASTTAGSPLQDDLLEAADAIEELVSNADKFKWISVEEPPEKSGLYLTYHAKRGSMTMHYSANNKAWNAFDHENEPKYALEVTHWMPISEPPEEVQE